MFPPPDYSLSQAAETLLEEGWEAREEDREELAHELFVRSLEAAERAGDTKSIAHALYSLADNALHFWPGGEDEPFAVRRKLCRDALALYREIDDGQGIVKCLNLLAPTCPTDECSRLLDESLELARRLNYSEGIVIALIAQTVIFHGANDSQSRLSIVSEAVAIARQCNTDSPLVRALLTLALMVDGHEARRAAYEEVHALCRRNGWKTRLLYGLITCAGSACDDVPDHRERYANEALELARELGNTVSESSALWNLSEVARARGNEGFAADLLAQSDAISPPIQSSPEIEEALTSYDIEEVFRLLGDAEIQKRATDEEEDP